MIFALAALPDTKAVTNSADILTDETTSVKLLPVAVNLRNLRHL